MTILRLFLSLLLVLVYLFSPVTSFAIDVGGENDSPIANDDTAITNEDNAVTIDVLANDSDPDGDVLTIVSISVPSHGTAVVNADDTVTYTPNANYSGSDSFSYTISDGELFDTALVAITILPVNQAPDCTAAIIGSACQ